MGVKKVFLYDVVIIRLIAITLLVLMHCLTIYGVGWIMPKGIEQVDAYFWFANFLYRIGIPGIIMVAGYIFAYQILCLKREYTLKHMIRSKFKRLIIPSIFFSIIYLVCFTPIDEVISVPNLISVLTGRGHMWFLPMLFWSFVIMTFVCKYTKRYISVLILSGILSLLPVPIPFGISAVCHYFIYFYFGYVLFLNKDSILIFINKKNVCSSWILYMVFLFLSVQITSSVQSWHTSTIIYKLIQVVLINAISLIPALIGIITLYLTVNFVLLKSKMVVSDKLIVFSSFTYGVYIFHQFILKFLYYHTSLPTILGSYILPWLAFVVVMTVSLLFTKLTLKTKFGRFLIG